MIYPLGQAGLDKKRAARAKREANKRKKEADAADVRSIMPSDLGSGGLLALVALLTLSVLL
jgi:hypothetical protein